MLPELLGIAELVSRCKVGDTLFATPLYAEVARADRSCPRRERLRPVIPRLSHCHVPNIDLSSHAPGTSEISMGGRYEVIRDNEGSGVIARYTDDREEYESLGRIDE